MTFRDKAWPLGLWVLLLLIHGCSSPSTTLSHQHAVWVASPPAADRYCVVDTAGSSIMPNGRLVQPLGRTVRVAPHPFGLALSPDGSLAVTANSGIRPFSVSILRQLDGPIQVQQIPEGAQNDEGVLESVFMGLAITPDNRSVYVSGGQANKVFLFDLKTGAKLDSISCAVVDRGIDYTHGYLGDMQLSADGRRLYVVDQIGFRLIIIDTQRKVILHNIPTGRYPFGLALSPDGQHAFVANVGMFEYSFFKHLDINKLDSTTLSFPAFGFGSEAMREGISNDRVSIAGLGDPNAPESFSVWKIALGEQPKVIKKIKTGVLVGQTVDGIPAVGGASPNSIVATDRYAFITNGNNDAISVVDFATDTVVHTIALKPHPLLAPYRGVIPFGLALSPNQQRLYVAASGLNAIAVIDVPSLSVKGYLPTGAFPSKLAVTPDGQRLIVSNAKGYGSGPNGGSTFQEGPRGHYIGSLMLGSVSVIDIPTDAQLASLTREVLDNNFVFTAADDPRFEWRKNNPVPLYPGQRESPIKYIVFISKENRTYDEVFGQLKRGNGEPAMARYGYQRSFARQSGADPLQDVTVMPNHLALAQRFCISDNFYVDADVSADGHRWLVNTYPNQWVEASVASSYGGGRRFRADSKAPGQFAFVGSSGAIYPEDYNEAGSMWDHLDRNGLSFFNFGFGVELAGTLDDSTMKYTGVKYLVNYPIPGPLFDHSSRRYPTYNMAIPDQFRADQFIGEFKERWLDSGQSMPQVLTIILPNDHGASERPQAGYPYRESYMMDNDLALGRIVSFLSQTPYWKNMAIVVTEDDAQDGQDHVDAHRSLLMLFSPYAKRNAVSHQHYSFGSIFKTFWNILGVPYLNQYDATAQDMADMFTDQPDFTPYQVLPVDPRCFDPQKALDPFDENFDWDAIIKSPKLDNVEDFLKSNE